MDTDIRGSALFREAEEIYRTARKPGTGQLSDAAELSVCPGASEVVFAGSLLDELEGAPATRICKLSVASAQMRVLTSGPNTDRLPKYSLDGKQVAFLSDRHRAGDFQLHLLDPASGAVVPAPHLDGWVEYLHWSPDGKRILLAIAGHGADVAGGQGAVASKRVDSETAPWMPVVETGTEKHRWRRIWIYELASGRMTPLRSDANFWEASWCGNDAVAAVVSCGPQEGQWYAARLEVFELSSRSHRQLLVPRAQLGCIAASPAGRAIAIVEAVCSDRGYVAGDLKLIDVTTGACRPVDTRSVDVTHTEWQSERHLLLAGHRGFESVVALFDAESNELSEIWCSTDITTSGRYLSVTGFGETGNCILVGEGFGRAPEIATLERGRYRRIRSFDLGYAEQSSVLNAVDRVCWNAPDGLEIHGWVLRPHGAAPHPLVMSLHGGPVWHSRPRWLGRAGAPILMLLRRGYAVFFPNPRGSSGRGQDFARAVVGDLGGADAQDCLSGVEHLVDMGVAEATRVGVTGISYGGFLSAWLVTQDTRFAAAVPVAPTTNQITQHLMSNIPEFVSLFLSDHYTNVGGRYLERSPIMHAHKVRTPVLNICGALDRCTPPAEALQFHNALLENGVKSVLVTYPQEGHGIRKFPATIDYAARVVCWFEQMIVPTQ